MNICSYNTRTYSDEDDRLYTIKYPISIRKIGREILGYKSFDWSRPLDKIGMIKILAFFSQSPLFQGYVLSLAQLKWKDIHMRKPTISSIFLSFTA